MKLIKTYLAPIVFVAWWLTLCAFTFSAVASLYAPGGAAVTPQRQIAVCASALHQGGC